MTSSPKFQPWCAMGGSWYACGNGTRFTGCCGSYPCTNNGCPAGNLRPASFNKTAYGTFPDQVCSAGLWYTCTGTNPSFMGCCVSNPCQQNGCPTGDLRSGYLSANPVEAFAFDPQPPLPGYTATNTTSTPTTTSKPLTATADVSTVPNSDAYLVSTPNSVGVIAGATVGGVLLLLLVLLAAFLVYRRRKRAQHAHQPLNSQLAPGKSWQSPSSTEYNPYYGDMSKLPPYASPQHQALLSPSMHSPQFGTPIGSPVQVHEAGSREISYVPYSPQTSAQPSPTWTTDHLSGTHGVTGLGVRSVSGNNEHFRAELGDSRR